MRIVCAGSLQIKYELFRDCLAYSSALNVGHAQRTSWMDIRVRFCTGGRLVHVHVLVLTLHTSKTTRTQSQTASKALDVVDRHWHDKWVSTGTDGERSMTSSISNMQGRFNQAEAFPVLRMYCGLHQLSLVAQKKNKALGDDTFVTTLTGMLSYLRHQQNLQTKITEMCPKFVSTRSLSMKLVTTWLAQHCVPVASSPQKKNPACKPSVSWCPIALCLDAAETILVRTYSCSQGLNALLSQQHALLDELCSKRSDLCPASGPPSDQNIA